MMNSNHIVHPSHYNTVPDIECMDVVKHFNFPRGNAIKYIWRAGHKVAEGQSPTAAAIDDLSKAIYYLNTEIERLRSAQAFLLDNRKEDSES